MSEEYEGKDGLARDIAKLRYEYRELYKPVMRQHWKDFKSARISQKFHEMTNLHVESARAAPYFWGHVTMISMVVSIVAFGFLAFYAFR